MVPLTAHAITDIETPCSKQYFTSGWKRTRVSEKVKSRAYKEERAVDAVARLRFVNRCLSPGRALHNASANSSGRMRDCDIALLSVFCLFFLRALQGLIASPGVVRSCDFRPNQKMTHFLKLVSVCGGATRFTHTATGRMV